MVLKNPRFKSCGRIYTIDFSLSLEIKSSEKERNDFTATENELSDIEKKPFEKKPVVSGVKADEDDKDSISSSEPLLEELTEEEGISNEVMLFLTSGCLTGIALSKVPVIMNNTGWFGVVGIVAVPVFLGYCGYLLCLSYSAILENISTRKIPDHYLTVVKTILGERYVMLFNVIFVLYLTLTLSIFLSEMGQLFKNLTPTLFQDLPHENRLRICIIILAAATLPFPLLRTKRRYGIFALVSSLSGIAAALMMTTALGMLKPKYHIYQNTTQKNMEFTSMGSTHVFELVLQISSRIAMSINLYSLHQVFPTFQSDMKDPVQAKTMVVASYAFPTVTLVVVSMMAYLTYSTNVPNDLIVGLSNSKQYLDARLNFFKGLIFSLQIIFCVNLGIVYLVNMNALNLYFEEGFEISREWQRFLLRAGSTLIIAGLAVLTPTNILKLYAINGILSCLIAVFFPILCFLHLKERRPISHYLFNGFILVLMFAVVILAFMNVIKYLIETFLT